MRAEEGVLNGEHPQVKEAIDSNRNVVVHFVRHGEITSYRPDAGLTEEGKKQSLEAGKRLIVKIGEGGMVKFISSPFQRALESNEEMIKGLNEAIEEQKRADIKIYTSRKQKRLRALDRRDDSQLRKLSKAGQDAIGYWLQGLISEEEVESPASVFARLEEFTKRRQKISQRLPKGPAIHYVCVTHSPIMRSLLKESFGEDLGSPKMGESIELSFGSGSPQVHFWDRSVEYN